jgi:hypothetical protein
LQAVEARSLTQNRILDPHQLLIDDLPFYNPFFVLSVTMFFLIRSVQKRPAIIASKLAARDRVSICFGVNGDMEAHSPLTYSPGEFRIKGQTGADEK